MKTTVLRRYRWLGVLQAAAADKFLDFLPWLLTPRENRLSLHTRIHGCCVSVHLLEMIEWNAGVYLRFLCRKIMLRRNFKSVSIQWKAEPHPEPPCFSPLDPLGVKHPHEEDLQLNLIVFFDETLKKIFLCFTKLLVSTENLARCVLKKFKLKRNKNNEDTHQHITGKQPPVRTLPPPLD